MDVSKISVIAISPESGLGSQQQRPQPANDNSDEKERDDAAEESADATAAGEDGASDRLIDRNLPSPPPGMGKHVDIVV